MTNRLSRPFGTSRGLALCALLGLPSAALAQEPAAAASVDRPVASVSIVIEGRPSTDPGLLDAVQTRVGAPLKIADVRETITHLYSLGRFDDVRVEAENASDGGVALRYVLDPLHTVTKVLFRGELGLPDGTLRSRMIERFGATPPLVRDADVASELEQLYHERGYLAASVRPAPPILQHDPESATLVFEVKAGPRTMIAHSTITGHPLDPPAQIQSRLEVEPGKPYQPGELRTRLADSVTAMRHRRYYEADATVKAEKFSEDRTQVDVVVDIQPGPLVTVQFTGDPLPKDKIAELVPIEREGSVDQDLLEDSARRITDYLNQQGYWKAQVAPPERKEAEGRLTIVVHVTRGRPYRVAPGGVEITGNQSIPIEELRPLLKLSQGDLFIASRLGVIEGAIKQLYRTKGFATADVASAANEVGDGLVKPVIVIKEGPRVLIGSVTITGNQALSTERLKPVLTLKPGDPYYGPAVARDRDALLVAYLNAGYASADVTAVPPVPVTTPDGARADVVFKVVEGPQTIVGHVFITGNVRTNPSVIQREILLQPGEALGLEDLTESRRRLSALGLFRRIEMSAISHGDPSLRDVVIAVEEAPQTTISYGGGLEIDRRLRLAGTDSTATEQFEFAPRGFFEVGRRNLGGRDRSANLYTRLSLRPSSDVTNRKLFGFPEYRIVGTYREPHALRSYGDLTSTAAVEQGVRTGFNFSRKGANAELTHRLSPTVRGSARYAFATTHIFDFDQTLQESDLLTVDRVFPQVRLSTVSLALSRDTRDDLLEPQRGFLLSADTTLAARAIGSEVGFTKTFLQGFVYRNLGRPHLVFAGGARLGVANPFLRVVQGVDADGKPTTTIVRDLPASERFFTGGDTTIRGFALDTVGVPATITPNGFPIGGDAEIILNAELRTHVYGPVGAVVFVDGGNVFVRAADLSLAELRGSVGFGLRYRSPIGPIRVDLGFKLDRRRIGTSLEPRYAIHFSIGQAF
jgi:outer membrane protein insertion porin family